MGVKLRCTQMCRHKSSPVCSCLFDHCVKWNPIALLRPSVVKANDKERQLAFGDYVCWKGQPDCSVMHKS